MTEKLKEREQLTKILQMKQQRGLKVVFTNEIGRAHV